MSDTIKVWSWHCIPDYFTKANFAEKGVIPPFNFNTTHFRLPVPLEVPANIESKDALGWAFDFFNWTHVDFLAPDEVNDSAREHNTHASQSVGDIVEIEGKGFWLVRGVGWEKLSIFDIARGDHGAI